MILEVVLKEKIDSFDFRTWNIQVPCGEGSQQLRWLAYAACVRMALITGDVPAKFVPQALKSSEGRVLDADKMIKDVLPDGSQVVVEYSSGPNAFTFDWDGRTHLESDKVDSIPNSSKTIFDPPLHNDDSENVNGAQSLDARNDILQNVLELVDWPQYKIQDGDIVKEAFKPFVGFIQVLMIWFSFEGDELEDKDFGVLNIVQFKKIFQDAKIPCDELFDSFIEEIFNKVIKVNGRCGEYQLSMIEIFPALYYVASGLFNGKHIEASEATSDLIKLIENFLLPIMISKLTPQLEDLQASSQKLCLVVVEKMKDRLELCLNACNPKSATKTNQKVAFRQMLPFLRKWHVLGEKWDPNQVRALVIYAFQNSIDVRDLVNIPWNFDFRVQELQKFLLGASYWSYKACISPIKISQQSYLREYLKGVFTRASVAKPLYTTYEEKKDYLRSMLIGQRQS